MDLGVENFNILQAANHGEVARLWIARIAAQIKKQGDFGQKNWKLRRLQFFIHIDDGHLIGAGVNQHTVGRDGEVDVEHDALLVFEIRGAFVDERIHAFFLIGRGKQRVEQAALEHHAVGQAAFKGAIDGFFGSHGGDL